MQLRAKWGSWKKKERKCKCLSSHGDCSFLLPFYGRIPLRRRQNYPSTVFKTVNEIRTRARRSPMRSLKLTACRGQKPRPPLPCCFPFAFIFATVIYNDVALYYGTERSYRADFEIYPFVEDSFYMVAVALRYACMSTLIIFLMIQCWSARTHVDRAQMWKFILSRETSFPLPRNNIYIMQ